jgi:hypothetical protein
MPLPDLDENEKGIGTTGVVPFRADISIVETRVCAPSLGRIVGSRVVGKGRLVEPAGDSCTGCRRRCTSRAEDRKDRNRQALGSRTMPNRPAGRSAHAAHDAIGSRMNIWNTCFASIADRVIVRAAFSRRACASRLRMRLHPIR